jgi:hypothetical protein
LPNSPLLAQHLFAQVIVKHFKIYLPVLILAALLIIIEAAVFIKQNNLQYPQLQDPDCYMRLVKIEQWMHGDPWYNSVIHRGNAPYGESNHWTRPLDILLLAGGLLLAPVFHFHQGLLWFGILFSPFLLLLALPVFQKSFEIINKVSSHFEKQNNLLSTVLFILQAGAISPFLIARPDHHSLLLLLFLFEITLFLSWLTNEITSQKIILLGAFCAFSMWVSIETLIPIGVFYLTLGILWLFENRKNETQNEKHFHQLWFIFSLSLTLFTAFFLMCDKPYTLWLKPEYDRISIFHLTLFTHISLFTYLIKKLHLQNLWIKILVTLLGGIVTLLTLLLLFPDFLKGPYAVMNPKAVQLWLQYVQEVKPLASSNQQGLADILIWLGPALIAFPYSIMRFLKARHPVWLFLVIAQLIFISISIYQIRWIYYATPIIMLPYAISVSELLHKLNTSLKFPWLAITRACLIVLSASVFSFAGLLLTPDQPSSTNKQTTEFQKSASNASSFAFFCKYLNTLPPKTILCFLDSSPEILYRTHHKTIGSPYHRNSEGILDNYEILSAENDVLAQKLIQKRSITLILLDKQSNESSFYSNSPNSLYHRLLDGNPPLWVKSFPLPENFKNRFQLYQIQ